MASSRNRRKRTVDWRPVMVLVLVAASILGLLYSPLTALRNLRIAGFQPHDRERLTQLAQSLKGVPFGRVDVAAFETQVLRGRDIYSVELSHNVFGSGVLRLKYRRPVAALKGSGLSRMFLDDHGVLFSSPEPFTGIRVVSLEKPLIEPVVAFAQPWPSAFVSDLCQKLDSIPELRDAVVHLDLTGRLKLEKAGAGSVDLGGADAMDEKLKKLRQLFAEQPELLSRVRELNLVDPEKPAISARGTSTR